jgi:hypothetical protein
VLTEHGQPRQLTAGPGRAEYADWRFTALAHNRTTLTRLQASATAHVSLDEVEDAMVVSLVGGNSMATERLLSAVKVYCRIRMLFSREARE